MSNIYLDRLDQFVEQVLLPEHNHGTRRRPNPAYQAVEDAIARARRHGDREAMRELHLQRRSLPSQDPNDPDYRRLRYVRYADDWLLGFAGPRHEAEEITSTIAAFLREELKLEELIHRLLAHRCEISQTRKNLEVHHIRKLADLNKPGRREKPAWMHLMAMRRRKTLVICRPCHEHIHAGRATAPNKDHSRAV